MRTDIYTKAVLTGICLALFLIAGMGWIVPEASVHAAPTPPPVSTQTWEYKIYVRSWAWKTNDDGYDFFWDKSTCSEDGNAAHCDVGTALDQIGAQGWELVSVEPRASHAGNAWAGATTAEAWTFKRPKR